MDLLSLVYSKRDNVPEVKLSTHYFNANDCNVLEPETYGFISTRQVFGPFTKFRMDTNECIKHNNCIDILSCGTIINATDSKLKNIRKLKIPIPSLTLFSERPNGNGFIPLNKKKLKSGIFINKNENKIISLRVNEQDQVVLHTSSNILKYDNEGKLLLKLEAPYEVHFRWTNSLFVVNENKFLNIDALFNVKVLYRINSTEKWDDYRIVTFYGPPKIFMITDTSFYVSPHDDLGKLYKYTELKPFEFSQITIKLNFPVECGNIHLKELLTARKVPKTDCFVCLFKMASEITTYQYLLAIFSHEGDCLYHFVINATYIFDVIPVSKNEIHVVGYGCIKSFLCV